MNYNSNVIHFKLFTIFIIAYYLVFLPFFLLIKISARNLMTVCSKTCVVSSILIICPKYVSCLYVIFVWVSLTLKGALRPVKPQWSYRKFELKSDGA